MATQPQPGPRFGTMYPLCSALKINGKPLLPVVTGATAHALYDSDDVKTSLGATRYNLLTTGTKWLRGFPCVQHRSWPVDHPEPAKQGCEVHCILADDLEKFLKAGN